MYIHNLYGSYLHVPLSRGDNNEINRYYHNFQLTQRDVENTIDRETSGNFGKGLLTMGIPIFLIY